MANPSTPHSYADAGVDIDAGEHTVARIKSAVRSTFNASVLTDLGAFGGFYALDTARHRQPVLVASTDGVGTKLSVASLARRFGSVGGDLVNHCTNDILCCGAEPLFFLDYYATGKLDPESAAATIIGMAEACKANGCALIGGETAEMPGMYRDGDFDLAGTIVGQVERDEIVTGKTIQAGDVLIGLPSTGLHTNGYSLARKLLLASEGGAFGLDETPPELGGATVADALLSVHRSYLAAVRAVWAAVGREAVRGISHVTGGGLVGNTKRILPTGLSLEINWTGWTEPGIFGLIRRVGQVPEADLRRTFNLGVGLVLIVRPSDEAAVTAALRSAGETPLSVGRVVVG